jgi:hypothetical protein
MECPVEVSEEIVTGVLGKNQFGDEPVPCESAP